MTASQPSLLTRNDTFFGVCEALGQDLGFNANYLRIAFGVALLLSPTMVICTYFGLGLVIALLRWVYPAHPAAPKNAKNDVRRSTVTSRADEPEMALAA